MESSYTITLTELARLVAYFADATGNAINAEHYATARGHAELALEYSRRLRDRLVAERPAENAARTAPEA